MILLTAMRSKGSAGRNVKINLPLPLLSLLLLGSASLGVHGCTAHRPFILPAADDGGTDGARDTSDSDSGGDSASDGPRPETAAGGRDGGAVESGRDGSSDGGDAADHPETGDGDDDSGPVDAGTTPPECTPAARICTSGVPQLCSMQGVWQNDTACAAGTQCTGAGRCLLVDGQPCVVAADCLSAACTGFFRDTDHDGFGATPAVMLCGAAAPDGYVTNSSDCCDTEPNAWPGQAAYFDHPRAGCGGYDYSCANGEELEFTLLSCCPITCATQPGHTALAWSSGTAPGCGVSQAWVTEWFINGNGGFPTCVNATTEQRIQRCR